MVQKQTAAYGVRDTQLPSAQISLVSLVCVVSSFQPGGLSLAVFLSLSTSSSAHKHVKMHAHTHISM